MTGNLKVKGFVTLAISKKHLTQISNNTIHGQNIVSDAGQDSGATDIKIK